MYFALKTLVSAIVIALVSTLAKKSSLFAALVASLPLTSLLAFFWTYQETKDPEQIAALSIDILWLVIPSLILFFVLPLLIRKGMSFYPSLGLAVLSTIIGYFSFIKIKELFN